MSDLTPYECDACATALTNAREAVPLAAPQLRARLRRLAHEYGRAYKYALRCEEQHMPYMLRVAGSLEPGEFILLGAGPMRTRRVTDSGIEIMDPAAGRWTWEDISSRATPVCVVDGRAQIT